MTYDLTKGKVNRVLLKFTIPLFISVIFQQMYSMADSLIAGRFVGEDALAAVGASYPITNIFNAVAIGCNVGCSVVISQLFGAKDYKRVKTAASTSLIFCLVLGGVLTALGIALTPALMRAIDTPENIFNESALYLAIYVGGFTFLFIYNIANGIFNSLGDSKTSLYFLIFSSVFNVVLDYVLVVFFNMGVGGVAWATFIAQGIAGVLSVITLLKRLKTLPVTEKTEMFSFELLKRIARISIPSVLQQSFVSVGNVFIQKLINGFGSYVVAGFAAAFKLNMFTINALCTIGNGVSSFTAQNYGAKKYNRIKEGMKWGSVFSIIAGCIFAVTYLAFNEQLLRLFMEKSVNEETVVSGMAFLKTVSPFFCFIGLKLVFDGVLKGTGSMKLFMVVTFTDLILRVILAFVFAPIWGYEGIWYSWPVGWTTATVLSLIFYKGLSKKLKEKTE
ncbi:MAG: MATE family efflux transporter [Clostridia bacterium]|nr:MATE family efflux transporter [Clostridia bacterium]